MTTTSSINNAFVPIYVFQAKNKPANGIITQEWLQADYSTRVKENKKPDWIKERSLIELIGAGLGLGGLFTSIISSKNQAIKLFSAITSLGGMTALIVGIFQGVDLRGGRSTNPETSTKNQNTIDPVLEKNDGTLKKGPRASEKAPTTINEELLKLSVNELILKLVENKNEAVIARLVEIGQPAVEPLTEALKDKSYTLRAGAATTLGKIKDQNSIDPLISLLKDKTISVKRSAALALGEIGNPRAIDPLITALKLKSNHKMGSDITTALGEIGQPAVALLIDLLFHSDDNLKPLITTALIKIGKPAIEPLILLLNNESDDIRALGIIALEKIGQPAFEALTAAAKSTDNAVKDGATIALALANIQVA